MQRLPKIIVSACSALVIVGLGQGVSSEEAVAKFRSPEGVSANGGLLSFEDFRNQLRQSDLPDPEVQHELVRFLKRRQATRVRNFRAAEEVLHEEIQSLAVDQGPRLGYRSKNGELISNERLIELKSKIREAADWKETLRLKRLFDDEKHRFNLEAEAGDVEVDANDVEPVRLPKIAQLLNRKREILRQKYGVNRSDSSQNQDDHLLEEIRKKIVEEHQRLIQNSK